MIVERCERSLLDLLSSQNRKVNIEDGSIVIRQVLCALNYLHDRKIIHRDIKLGNILLKNNLQVKVIDFGLAKNYNPEDKPTICGTPNYLAPEVLNHSGHRPVSDIWSVGCVLVVLLSGQAPFEGDTTEDTYELIINNEPKLPTDIPHYVSEFILLTLEKDAIKRKDGKELLLEPYMQKFSNLSPTKGLAFAEESFYENGQIDQDLTGWEGDKRTKNWHPEKRARFAFSKNLGSDSLPFFFFSPCSEKIYSGNLATIRH